MVKTLSFLLVTGAVALVACSSTKTSSSGGSCSSYVSALQDNSARCRKTSATPQQTADAVARLSTLCTNTLNAPGNGITAAAIDACADELRTSCDPGDKCSALGSTTGTLPDGTACGSDAQCQGGACEGDATTGCGKCAPARGDRRCVRKRKRVGKVREGRELQRLGHHACDLRREPEAGRGRRLLRPVEAVLWRVRDLQHRPHVQDRGRHGAGEVREAGCGWRGVYLAQRLRDGARVPRGQVQHAPRRRGRVPEHRRLRDRRLPEGHEEVRPVPVRGARRRLQLRREKVRQRELQPGKRYRRRQVRRPDSGRESVHDDVRQREWRAALRRVREVHQRYLPAPRPVDVQVIAAVVLRERCGFRPIQS